MHALLVEDDAVSRAFLAELLKSRGWSVAAVADAEAALERFTDPPPPDAVVTDQRLPGMNGIELAGRIRAQDETPVLLVSAAPLSPHEHAAAVVAGVSAVLSKPVAPEALFIHLQELTDVGAHEPALDEAALVRQLGSDQELIRSMVGIFLEDVPLYLERLHSAAGGGDLGALAEAAHGLAGALRLLGAGGARDSASRLERACQAGDPEATRRSLAALDLQLAVLCGQLRRRVD